jgi:biotin carboxyl carrier protein
MKNYTITVNGTAYEVTVEENASGAVKSAPVVAAPKVAAPKAPAPAPKAAAPAAGGSGSVKITAGAAGKVYSIAAKVGQAVKQNDPVVILEAMKMEIPMVAPKDGTIVSIEVAAGDGVEAGTLLATMN